MIELKHQAIEDEILSPVEFLELIDYRGPVLIRGCRGELYLADHVVAFRFESESEWTILSGTKYEVRPEHASAIDPADILDALIDTTHTISCERGHIAFVPNANLRELSIIAGLTDGPGPGWLHADEDLDRILNQLQVQHEPQ